MGLPVLDLVLPLTKSSVMVELVLKRILTVASMPGPGSAAALGLKNSINTEGHFDTENYRPLIRHEYSKHNIYLLDCSNCGVNVTSNITSE